MTSIRHSNSKYGNVSTYEILREHPVTFLLIVFLLQQDRITPLIVAAKEGHTDTVKELLSSGATVDLADQVSAWKCMLLLITTMVQSKTDGTAERPFLPIYA